MDTSLTREGEEHALVVASRITEVDMDTDEGDHFARSPYIEGAMDLASTAFEELLYGR